jgi:hypothetical protein
VDRSEICPTGLDGDGELFAGHTAQGGGERLREMGGQNGRGVFVLH